MPEITLEQLAARIGARVVGDGTIVVHRCAPIDRAAAGDLTFLANRKYLDHLRDCRASAVVIAPGVDAPEHMARLVAEDPYFAYRNAMIELHGFREHPAPMSRSDVAGSVSGAVGGVVSDLATVHPSAVIGEGCSIHPRAVVERHAHIGARTVLYPGVYVGPEARVGDDCVLYPNVVIYDRCEIGHRVVLHAGTVIGSDGFGHATHKGAHHKIPHAGTVVIEDDVEMGACCAIERAAMGQTRIGQGTKFADLISIGHNTTVGRHCLFVSLVGVSGSVDVGDYVVLGGQVGVAGHLRIGNGVQAAARTAIVQDVPDGMKVGGVPAVPLDQAKRNALAALDLYDIVKRVRKLEKHAHRSAQSQAEP